MKVSDNGGIVCLNGIIYRANKVTLNAALNDGECSFGGFYEVDEAKDITIREVNNVLHQLDNLLAQAWDEGSGKYNALYEGLSDAYDLIAWLAVGEVKE